MSKVVIALGHKARNGKGEFAEAIYRNFPAIELMSFGDALREEVTAGARELDPTNGINGLRLLCQHYGVPYDPEAKIDDKYPYGKQRALLQWWGTEYRRAQDLDYWVKQVADKIQSSQADGIVIDDLRFVNEFEYLGHIGATRIKLTRLGFDNQVREHSSETALDGYTFDLELGFPDGNLGLLRRSAVALYSIIAARDYLSLPNHRGTR